ncbi:MAG: DUF4197 domain-containing protein [Hyphomonadaceae bacterium]|nr:DUF4197 domain-containing protein [Hyphomonadaceae bacterium]
MHSWLGAALIVAVLGVTPAATAQSKQDWSKIASDILHQKTPGDKGNLSKGDVTSGLKEALTVASDLASKRLSRKDGFMGDVSVRIPLPGVLGDAQKRLQPYGMSGLLDDLQLKVNRAAESATPQAQKLMIDAVKTMTIDDAMGVLRGGDTAATDFLRKKTEANLRKSFRPYFDQALTSTGALTQVDGVVAKYGMGLVKTDSKTWLADNATTGALNGLFYYVAREEQAIRRDPVKRTSDILRKVFGG